MTPAARRLLALPVVVATLGGLAWWGTAEARKPDAPLTLYGNVDIRDVNLGFRVDGRIARLLVDEGDAVRAGQVIGRLDPAPLTAELDEAIATAAARQSRLGLLRAGSRVEVIAQAAAERDEQRANLDKAEADLRRLSDLRGSGATSERAYDDARNARAAAAARLRAAEQALAEARNGNRPQDIAQAAADLDQARASAERVRLRLQDTVLKAPSDGVILSRAAEVGAIVAAGTTIFTEALSRPTWARIYVEEPDLGRVAPGAIVELTTDAAPGRIYRGRVGYVSPTAEFTPKTVETPDLRTNLVYRARVVVLDPDSRLRQGMPITVRLPAKTAG